MCIIYHIIFPEMSTIQHRYNYGENYKTIISASKTIGPLSFFNQMQIQKHTAKSRNTVSVDNKNNFLNYCNKLIITQVVHESHKNIPCS